MPAERFVYLRKQGVSRMNIDSIEQTLFLPYPQERVFRAATRPEELSKWFGDRVFLDPVAVGSEIIFEWDEYGRVAGLVEAFDPPTLFAYRWRAHGADPVAPLAPGNSTLVTFRLQPDGMGTRLQVIETGFASLPEEIRQAAYRENERGWQVELKELVAYFHESN